MSMLWWLPVSPCHSVDEFIYSTVLPWVRPPCEHAAVDDVVPGITLQGTRLSILLQMDKWWFQVQVCFLSHLLAPPLWSVTAFDFPEPGSQFQPCQPCAWYYFSMERYTCQWLFLRHRGFLSLGLKFCSEPMMREKLWKWSETWGTYAVTRQHAVGAELWLEPDMCQIFSAVSSWEIFLFILTKVYLQYW